MISRQLTIFLEDKALLDLLELVDYTPDLIVAMAVAVSKLPSTTPNKITHYAAHIEVYDKTPLQDTHVLRNVVQKSSGILKPIFKKLSPHAMEFLRLCSSLKDIQIPIGVFRKSVQGPFVHPCILVCRNIPSMKQKLIEQRS